MSEPSNGAWPFQEIPEEEGLDISAIFGDSSAAPQGDPFAPPAAVQSFPQSPAPVMPEVTPAVTATSQPATAPIGNGPSKALAEAPAENPIAAAFEQKTAENTKKGLLEKPPVFYHKGVKEEIDDPSMTFEELRIRKSDDFTDLEEGKRVSWSVEYCGIRKEVKDPKGTTIISMKEIIERSREFLDALKKTKDKDPCCYVKPKVEMKTKGNAAYKGKFGTLEEARTSDKVICLIPSNDGRIYELRKMEQGEFTLPRSPPHLRNHGAPERRGRENRQQYAGSLLGGLHTGHLRPRYHRCAAESSPDDGEHPLPCRLMLSAIRSRWGQRLGQKKAAP